MKVTGNDLIGWMESWAPRSLAEPWDHPGLQVGDPRRRVTKVLISLDLTEENVDLAVREGAEMVISHHPFLFKAIRELDLRTYKGRVIEKLVKHDILSFAAHTNLDTAKGGVNDALAAALSLSDTEGLVFEQETKERKLALYVKPVTAKVLRHTLSELYGDAVNHFYLWMMRMMRRMRRSSNVMYPPRCLLLSLRKYRKSVEIFTMMYIRWKATGTRSTWGGSEICLRQ